MNNLEKILFIEISAKQSDSFLHPEYNETLKKLTDDEKEIFYTLSQEVHTIWNLMNAPKNIEMVTVYVSFEEYMNDNNVSPLLIQIIEDFNFDFKNKISIQTKNAIIKRFGKKYYDDNFGI